MKRPIDVDDTRVGDLLRWESGETAHEFRRGVHGRLTSDGQHYLLDRPTPAVVLPTQPTLGWITFPRDHWLGIVDGRPGRCADPGCFAATRANGYSSEAYVRECVTAFTPATAVPTDALDALRRFLVHSATGKSLDQIRDFLTCVRAANGTA